MNDNSTISTTMMLQTILLLRLLGAVQPTNGAIPTKVQHVIHVVVDGLRPDAMSGNPNFDYLAENGACTTNARLDPLSSQTLPNHYSMFTGSSTSDHGYTADQDDGGYLPSGPNVDIFDLVHDAGGSTAFFGSKEKFAIFDRSWNIDEYHYMKRSFQLVPLFLERMAVRQFNFTFLHIRAPDRAGHGDVGAASDSYRDAVVEADAYVGQVMDLAASLDGDTAIILTADHGFASYGNHGDPRFVENFRIPFCVFGPGVKPGADLYGINASNGYVDPGDKRARDSDATIRNVYAGVLASDWLGLMPEFGPLSRQYMRVSDKQNKDEAVVAKEEIGHGPKEIDTEESDMGSAPSGVPDELLPPAVSTGEPSSSEAEEIIDLIIESANDTIEPAADAQPFEDTASPARSTPLSTKQVVLYTMGAVFIIIGVGAVGYLVGSGRAGMPKQLKKETKDKKSKPLDRADTASMSSGQDRFPSSDQRTTPRPNESHHDLSRDIESSVEVHPLGPRCDVVVKTSLVSTQSSDAIEVVKYNIHQLTIRESSWG